MSPNETHVYSRGMKNYAEQYLRDDLVVEQLGHPDPIDINRWGGWPRSNSWLDHETIP